MSEPVVCCTESQHALAAALSLATVPSSSQQTMISTTPCGLPPSAIAEGGPTLKLRYKIGSSPPYSTNDRYTYLRLSVFLI